MVDVPNKSGLARHGSGRHVAGFLGIALLKKLVIGCCIPAGLSDPDAACALVHTCQKELRDSIYNVSKKAPASPIHDIRGIPWPCLQSCRTLTLAELVLNKRFAQRTE